MPTLNLTVVGDPKGAEVIKKALIEVRRQAFITKSSLESIGKTRVASEGIRRLEADAARAKTQTKSLAAENKVASITTKQLEAEVAKLSAKYKVLTGATKTQTRAARGQVTANSALRDSTRGVAGALGGLWFAYGQILPLMAAFAVASSFRKGITEGAEFAKQMQFVKGVTGETVEVIESASRSILSLGESNLRGPVELAKGMRVLTKAGLDLHSSLSAIKPVTDLSIVGELDMAKATTIATAAMNTFGKTAKDLPNIVDIIGKASIISATEVGDLGNALSFMTGSVGLLNASLPEMSAQLAIAAQRGVVGSKAGTALNRAWLNLAAQSPKTKRALADMGVQVFNDAGKFRPMDKILSDLHNNLSKFTKEDQSTLIKNIFGVRSIKAIVPVIAEANNRLPKFRQEIDKASDGIGTMARITNDLKDNLDGAGKAALASFSSSLISAFQAAEPAFTGIAESFDRMFRTTEFREFMASVMRGLATVTKFLIEHRAALASLGKAYLAFKVGGVIAGPVVAGFGAIFGPKTGFLAMSAASKVAGGSLTKLAATALGLVGPLGWVTLGAAGLVTLIWQLNKFKEMKRTQFDLLSSDIGKNFESKLDRLKNKVQAMREEAERLQGVDLVARSRASLKADLDILITAEDAMKQQIDRAKAGKVIDIPGFGKLEAGAGTKRAKAIRSLIGDLELVRTRLSKAKREYKEFVALQTTLGTETRKRDFFLADQRGEGEATDPAGRLGTGTDRIERFDLPGLKTSYNNQLAALNSTLQRRKKLLEASRSAGIIQDKAFVAESKSLANSSYDDRIRIMSEFYLTAQAEDEKGGEDQIKVQQFMAKLSVDVTKAANKQKLDETLALYAALGRSTKTFAASIAKSEANTAKALKSQAKSASKDVFGKTNTRVSAGTKLALLKQEIDERAALLRKETISDEASVQARGAFYADQYEAITQLHREHEEGKTAITKAEGVKRRKEAIDGFRSLHQSTSTSLGIIGDMIGQASEKAFRRSKRFKLAQAYMDMAAGAAGAFADTGGHIVIRIAAAAAAALAGLSRVRQIKSQTFSGQAHAGISNIPREGTYLLDKNERVVKPQDNQKLTKFLDKNAGDPTLPGSGQTPIVVQFNVNAIDGSSVASFFAANESRIVGMIQGKYDQRLATGGPVR